MQEFNALDFADEHARLLEERNGQWMDESLNTSLWLSQGCYVSERCVVEGEGSGSSFLSLPNIVLFQTWLAVRMLFSTIYHSVLSASSPRLRSK